MSLAAIMMLSMVNVAAVVTFPRLSRVRHMPLEALQVTADRKRSFAPLCPPRMQTAHLRVRVHPMAHDRRRFFHPRTTTLRALASSPEPASSPELSREPVRRSRTMPRLSPYESALQSSDSPFRAWPRLNDGVAAEMAGVSRRQRLELSKPPLDALFAGDTLQAKLSRALAERRALDRKEFFETWEFFSQARGSLRCAPAESTDPPPPGTHANSSANSSGAGTLVEVAGGHGLFAVLCAVFEYRRFSKVLIIDRRQPPAFGTILEAAAAVAPWISDRISYIEGDFTTDVGDTLDGAAVACIHGCNSLTDRVIETAAMGGAESIVCMPCCYAHADAAEAAPRALRRSLGVALAADIHRTYNLEAACYDVSWRHIPSVITPMNRILLARRSARATRRPGGRA